MEDTASPIRLAIESLTAAELRQLSRYAEYIVLRFGRGGLAETAEDLVQETILKILSSSRPWNPEVPFVPFFRGCMKSIAWNWNKRPRLISLEDLESPNQEEGVRRELNVAAANDVELETSSKQEAERLMRQFKGDDLASRVLELWMVGNRRHDVLKKLEISELQYSTAVKRISRRLNKEAIEGRHP
jgi:DNA-directed RNA polymerase specialized sigma24 family protein